MNPRSTPRFGLPAHEPVLPRAERRAKGVYYTPPEIARQIVRLALDPLLAASESEGPSRILDLACGAGAFLVEAFETLLSKAPKPLTEADRLSLLKKTIFGVDIDPQAVATARKALAELVVTDSGDAVRLTAIADELSSNIWSGDTLTDPRLNSTEPFDAVIGNPPYVSIRELAKSRSRAEIDTLRRRYRTARGNFDLYVLFLERALELLRTGGRCGLLVPNKWQTLDYAQACRELLDREATLEQVVDLSDEKVFHQASVNPQVLVLRKEPPTRGPVFSAPAIFRGRVFDVESRVETMPLGKIAKLHCGTPGFAAAKIAARLIDVGQESRLPEQEWQVENLPHCRDFITSGNIDRYQIRLGNVRFLGRTYTRPRLSLDVPELSDKRRNLFRSPKIVIAGLSKRIEAAWDDQGLALGVQVFAAVDCQDDPHELLAILNSKLLSYLFRTRFAAKRLKGDYLAINKGQLAQLPIAQSRPLMPTTPGSASDAEIDQHVYRLYRLTPAEIDEVEGHFAGIQRRAA